MRKMAANVPDTIIAEHGSVQMVNSAVDAMQMLQAEMAGEGEKAGLVSEDDVNAAIKNIRIESE